MLLVGDAGVRLRPVADKFAAEADDQVSGALPGVAKKAAGFFAAAFAAVKIGGFLKDAVGQAVDLGENVSKVGVVFGDAAGVVNDFAATASTALGQSRNQALEAAGSFGTLFRGMSLGEAQSAKLSTSLVGVASDMASFGNASPQEALDALRSGLVGETEPLRRFGVMLSANAITQEATRLGLEQVNGEFTAGAKAQATYSLIMAQTAIQHGDFARTSAGLANQQRILKAQVTDVSTNIGGLFVPALAIGSQAITAGIMPAILKLTAGLPAMGATLGSFFDFAKAGFEGNDTAGFAEAQSQIGERFQLMALDAGNAGAIFGEVFADGTAGAEILADKGIGGIAARSGAAAFILKESFGDAFGSLQTALAPVLGGVLDTLMSAFTTIGGTISSAFSTGGAGGGLTGFAAMLSGLVQGALPLIIDYFTRWASVVQAVIPIIVTVLQGLVPVVAGIFQQIGPVLAQLVPIIGQVGGLLAGTLLTVINALAPVIPGLVASIGQVAQVLAGAFMGILQALLPVLPVLVNVIAQVASMFAGALADALSALMPILPPLVQALATIAQVLVGALMGALQAILPIIPTLIGVFLQLIMSAVMPLLPLLPILANLIAMILSAVAPLIPPLLQLVMVIVQLVVAAIVPLLPLLPVVIGLFTMLIRAVMPIIGVLLQVIGGFVGLVSTVASLVIGFVSTVIGAWTSLFTGIGRIVSNIVSGATTGFRTMVSGIKSIFSGIADFVGGMFEGIGGAVKGAINAVISGINGTVIAGINLVIDGVNVVNPFDDIPHVPKIPKFHMGGEFLSGLPGGEGYALLRDRETVVTPEDRDRAAALLVAAAGGRLPGGAAPAAGPAPNITIEEHLHMTEPTSPGEVAAATSQAVAWNLRAGVSRLPGLTGATA